MKLFGFTLLRNALKYDYCFVESLQSLTSLCDEVYVALGDNEDDTGKYLEQFTNLHITNTVWNMQNRNMGNILAEQTNIALSFLKDNNKAHLNDGWGMYLQADEVIHPADFEQIKKDIALAEAEGCDAIRFRYLHFWLHSNQIAINKKWYPVEVRCIKLNSNISSTGDAQGFSNIQKVYQSNVYIYHYGHVRNTAQYELKKAAFHRLYHTDSKVAAAASREEKKYKKTKTLPYLGVHPLFMKNRILALGHVWEAPVVETVYIVLAEGTPISEKLLGSINAGKVVLANSFNWGLLKHRNKLVFLKPNWWQKILFPSKVKNRPESKQGPDWEPSFQLVLKLSEKGVGLKMAPSGPKIEYLN